MYTPPPADPIEYVDWYLEHKRTNLHCNMKAVYVWSFTLRTKDTDGMRALAKALRKSRYLTTEQEVVEEISGVGRKRKSVAGPPMVTAYSRGKPSAAALKRRVDAIIALAQKHNATYSDLSSMDVDEFEMLFGPPRAVPLEDACWQLRAHSDLGMKKGASIEYTFCIVAKDVKACRAALKKAGFAKVTPAPKDADWTISVSVPGVNNEKHLRTQFAEMKKAAKAAGGLLKGLEM